MQEPPCISNSSHKNKCVNEVSWLKKKKTDFLWLAYIPSCQYDVEQLKQGVPLE